MSNTSSAISPNNYDQNQYGVSNTNIIYSNTNHLQTPQSTNNQANTIQSNPNSYKSGYNQHATGTYDFLNPSGQNLNNTYQYPGNNLTQNQYSASANSNNSFWWSKFQQQQQITPTTQNGGINNGTSLPYPTTNYSTPNNYTNSNSLDGIQQYNNLLRNLQSKSSSSTSSSPNSSSSSTSSSNSSMSNSLTSHLNSLVEQTNNYHHLFANGHALPMTPESSSNTHELSPTSSILSYSSARQNKHDIQNSKCFSFS